MNSQSVEHPEWERENSLTTPDDRNPANRCGPDRDAPKLTDDQVDIGMKTINNKQFLEKCPKYDRSYQDPPPLMQSIGLISFVPAKGATPNASGVYGMAKLRGNYATEIEANDRAEYLIRKVDSYHQIYHMPVGRPFPITSSPDYVNETSEIDISKQITECIGEDLKEKRQAEKQEGKSMERREQDLLSDAKKTESEPYDDYITSRNKHAQLSWMYFEHHKKLKEVINSLIKTRHFIADMDVEYPEYKNTYYKSYMDAREAANITANPSQGQDNFIRFLVEEDPIPEVDQEVLPPGKRAALEEESARRMLSRKVDGEDGEDGADGEDGVDGEDGEDGADMDVPSGVV